VAKKILVVDDEPDLCDVLRDFFQSKGWETVIALSGEEAISIYTREDPNVVLLDIVMPGKDGLETLRELKALDPGAHVIMVTAVEEDELAKQAMNEGAFDYIIKPVDHNYLELVLMTKLALLTGDE